MSEERKQRLAQKAVVSARISETSRLVGFGIVAWVFAVHTSETSFAADYVRSFRFCINLAGILGMLAIAFDYWQYLCAYSSVQHALTREDNDYKYDESHIGYVFQNVFYVAKQVCAVLGSLAIVITFGVFVIFGPS